MATWNPWINSDMQTEYRAAFTTNGVETALEKIDVYVRGTELTESDAREWSDYYYSVADFMWSKGILTDAVKTEALRLIDSGFGLEQWEYVGQKALEKRKEALQKFRDKITSPQPSKKKISVNIYKPIFKIGDVVTFQLQTADKAYKEGGVTHIGGRKNVSEKEFKEADGKYVVARKIGDRVSWTSVIEPAVRDIWPVFQLYSKVFDEPPKLEDVMHLSAVDFPLRYDTGNPDGLFLCEGSLSYFRKRKHIILGNDQHDIDRLFNKYHTSEEFYNAWRLAVRIFLGINDVDEIIINAISDR